MATRKPNAQGLRRFPQPMLKDHGLPGTRKGPIQTKKVRPKFHDMAVQVTGYDEIPEDRRMTREQHLGDASDRVVRAVSANTVHSEEAYRRKDDAEGDDASQLGEQFDDKEIMASEWVDAAPQKVKPTTPVIGDMKVCTCVG
ncbi:hypothetical protein SARC_09239 [Sphaeroforma arctica JP610]|uniref:Uncharacterized protein n=1 Tax=Sphaeroforma arctica JP610 TaxID=667725 RepID=A0A0L0FP90_9EUKA|nr:hypothetical protein SARC_09239 [Sphaeroforma arctica JP610]KNC78326.1 hypothetical protein SARC_09239 [Sphaeroforma arctica JP610]|eukprot:XP_014152228.1 hypothetical protein SARC_09239 [Sphaeroforma arctica JP610]